MNAFIFKLVANTVHIGVPLLLVAGLLTYLDGVLVLVVVTKESVDAELILEAHREGLILMWEVNEYVLLIRLSQLHEVLLELFRLGFFDSLRDDNHSFLELLLLDVNRFVFELNHSQSLESWVSRTGKLNAGKDFWRESLCANILIIRVKCELGLVSFKASHLCQRASKWLSHDTWIEAIREERETRVVPDSILL